jgi:hypothetical protein
MYNLMTIYTVQPRIGNESEASSFYYFFPAVFLAVLLSKRLLTNVGVLGWLLMSYLAGMLVFSLSGIPERTARLSLMSYVPPYRADIAIGLASIFLCVYVLAIVKDMNKQARSAWHKIMPWIVSAAISLLFIYHGWVLKKATEGFPSVSFILVVALIAGFISYCLLAGKSTLFCGALGAILVATSSFFNPLATNLDHIYNSELAQQIVKLNNEATDHPLWICYGGVHPGVLVSTLGGRSLTGIQWPPQLSLWRKLDGSDGAYENIYNRYALVQLTYRPDAAWVSFSSPQDDAFEVRICPDHPVLKKMGARFVLAMGDSQQVVAQSNLDLIYTSTNGSFSIFEIPARKN